LATTIHVPLNKGYDVIIDSNILDYIGKKVRLLFDNVQTAVIVTDDNVKELYLEPVMRSLSEAGLSTIPYSVLPGEASKNYSEYFALLNYLAGSKLMRSDIIVALGGGVVGDLAGFAAATYLRGIRYVQVPTTLLAMVDSSVGGKTGIDLKAGKNLAGAFHQPSLVLCDTDVLDTLPASIYEDGLAEIIKYAMIGNSELLELLLAPNMKEHIASTVAACVRMKRDIVVQDEFDTGERKLLNFGHTVGHAVEFLSNYKISHGSAVGIGMTVMTCAAVKKNLCPPECLVVLKNLLSHFNLPNNTNYSAKELYNAAICDKKRQSNHITIIIPTALGKCELKTIPIGTLLNWIEMGLCIGS